MYIRYAHAALAIALLATPSAAQMPAHLAGFQAYLFNSKTGQLSPDILAAKTDLGNVPAGSYSSVSTFVVVRVELGAQAPVPANVQVRLLAVESGVMPFAAGHTRKSDRVILDTTGSLGTVNDQGVTYVAFWLAGTGCRAITLKATLRGAGPPSAPLTATLPFTCYE